MASDKGCRWFACDKAEMRTICWKQDPPRFVQRECPYAKAGNYSECPDYWDGEAPEPEKPDLDGIADEQEAMREGMD
jgi:hypothetical protein